MNMIHNDPSGKFENKDVIVINNFQEKKKVGCTPIVIICDVESHRVLSVCTQPT